VTAMAADARPPRRGCAVPRRAVPCRAPRGVLALPGAPGRYSACRLSFSVLCGKLSLFLFKYLGNRACYLAEDLCQWLFFFFFHAIGHHGAYVALLLKLCGCCRFRAAH